jgi:hypothetical protein
MRALHCRRRRWLDAVSFWAAVLLVLPGCGFTGGVAPPAESVIFCDIPTIVRRCATTGDKAAGLRFAEAAVALNEGRSAGNVALDYSPQALANCGGEPEAVLLEGPFPDGIPVCVNCPTGNPAITTCQQRCYNFYGSTDDEGRFIPDFPPHPSVKAFCDANARLSTNMPDGCIDGACVPQTQTLRDDFHTYDPRRVPEPVIWTEHEGTVALAPTFNSLQRDAATTGNYDAGAVSYQWITRGDAFAEFRVLQSDAAHSQIIGLSPIPAGCAKPEDCKDIDPHFSTIPYAFQFEGGQIYVLIGGSNIGAIGTYASTDRFRIRLRDNEDGTATLSFTSLIGNCMVGTICGEMPRFTHGGTQPSYPLRLDTSLRDKDTTFNDVRLVRIR